MTSPFLTVPTVIFVHTLCSVPLPPFPGIAHTVLTVPPEPVCIIAFTFTSVPFLETRTRLRRGFRSGFRRGFRFRIVFQHRRRSSAAILFVATSLGFAVPF
ncbi:hypothetical protein NY2A_b523R [Paramecium bursaria Chlorella virus NY2A]|uniref:Uncharacterized protein b523R n=1 Tax=Paramecium bursaria Chlorella virus NY2A TaxID=46021 RepID=A7IX48_PBCVN|nr:hypothetical protein NY2A_b523R [Paramecium bursaria Chlorella virus NY2A]ABT14922.1 hypothetical protein NY2A_b523R [Paramecium bursaria Chlorella virus NY2A]